MVRELTMFIMVSSLTMIKVIGLGSFSCGYTIDLCNDLKTTLAISCSFFPQSFLALNLFSDIK